MSRTRPFSRIPFANHCVGHLEKSESTCFLSKFMEFFTILYENTWTSPQLTFLTNSIGIIFTVTCISHVPDKKWRVIFTPPTNKLSLRLVSDVCRKSRIDLYRWGFPIIELVNHKMQIYLTVEGMWSIHCRAHQSGAEPKFQIRRVFISTSVVSNYRVRGWRGWPG